MWYSLDEAPLGNYLRPGYNQDLLSFPRIRDRTPAIAIITKEAHRAEYIPAIIAFDIPPDRFVVPMNISKASALGIEAEATDMAMTKLPRTPIFCKVLRRPDRLP